jgi:hypothetical protein
MTPPTAVRNLPTVATHPTSDRFRYRNDMAGYDESRPPDVEVYIEDGDGPPLPQADPMDGRPPTGAGRRLGAALGAIALFAFGVVLGRTSLGTPSATPTDVTVTTTDAPIRSQAPTQTAGSRAASPPTDPAVTAVRLVDAVGSAVSGACGRRAVAPRVDDLQPLADTAAVHVIAGGDPAPADLGAGTVGGSLFVPEAGQVVTDIAPGRDATVLLVAPCAGAGPGRVVRVSTGGQVTTIPLPDRTRRVTLVTGGDRVWISASPGSYGFAPVTLLAADGSGDTVTLPGGLEPLAGAGRQIVGQYNIGGMPSGLFGVLDTDKASLVRQFGTSDSTAMNAIADGEYVVAAPWVCGATCDVLRFRIATGELHRVRLDPASDRILSGGGAVSADGLRVAVSLYTQPRSPEPFEPYRLGVDSPNDATRVGLLNLADGSVRALPGLTLGGTVSPALAFSPDGRWIIVAAGAGYRTRLLLYTADGNGLYDPHVDIPGLVSSPPLAVVARPGA